MWVHMSVNNKELFHLDVFDYLDIVVKDLNINENHRCARKRTFAY